MRAEEAWWPFRPIHITNDGETIKDPKRPGLDKLKGVGIITNDHLRGIETTMCATLQKPTTLIEFAPEGEDVRAVRTDSPLLDATPPPCGLLPSCRLLREIDVQCCHNCDIEHASLFKGLKISELTTKVQERINDNDYIQAYRKRSPGIEIRLREMEIHNRTKRYFLEYDCPLLGYRETVFPVFFESTIVAVFFAGQICLIHKKDDMIKIQDSFFASNLAPNEVKKNKKRIQQKHETSVDKFFLKEDEKYDGYDKLLKQICVEVEKLEKTLEDEINRQRERFVKSKIDAQIKIFQEEFRRSEEKENLQTLWENVGRRMEVLIKDFYIRYVVIFAMERPMQQERHLLGVVASKGDTPQELSDRINRSDALKYNLGKLTSRIRNKPVTSARDSGITKEVIRALEGFDESFDVERNLIRVFPLPFPDQGSVVVLIGYYDDNLQTSIENRSGSDLDMHINVFYQSVLLALSSILAKAAQENISASLRVLGHEADQLNFGLEGMRRRYLRNATTLKDVKDKKLDDICRDIKGYFGQLNFLFKQATQAVTELPVTKKNRFWAYREILFKWEDMYRLTLRLKNLKFDIFRTWKKDPQRPPVYGDKNLLEQLVYSLVSNAVKYCHKGTKIHLDCVKEEPDKAESPHILTVTNYGRMFDCESPFGLGTRGKNVRGIEGLGLGLYNGERIAKAHDGSLKLEQFPNGTKISDFNVPLIEPYIEREFNGKNDWLMSKLKDELKGLKKSGKYYQIVAHGKNGKKLYAPKKTELIKFLEEKTWEIKFRLTIPAKRS